MARPGRTVRSAVPGLFVLAVLLAPLSAGAVPGFSGRAPMPFPTAWASAQHPTLSYSDIACPGIATCTAIGAYLSTSGAYVPSADAETKGTWQAPASISLPPGASSYPSGLRSISCPSLHECVAVGTAESASPLLEPIIGVETDGTWTTSSSIPIPKGAVLAYLWSIWCSSTTSCLAVGSYATSISGEVHGFIDTESDGTWRFTTSLTDPVSRLVAADLQVFPQDISCSDP
jgi:hypothetical protein